MTLKRLHLRKHEDRRLRAGHVWVFSNEVDIDVTPIRDFVPGELALVEDYRGHPLGIAYVNPESLITARILTRNPKVAIDGKFLHSRIERALQLRERLYAKPYYRLIYGESDGLPGVVVDRFGDTLVLQTNTAGAEILRPLIVDALTALISPSAIVARNDSGLRQLEGLQPESIVLAGSLDGNTTIEENHSRFLVDALGGQKTGWFFDHRENRAKAASLASGRRVLDLFSYSGSWGIQAAAQGAKMVDCVDSSAPALELASENAKLNGVEERVAFHRADVFEFLKAAREERRLYDLVVLDPPALIKRKKDVKAGIEAYHRLNQGALQILAHGGILVSASCSYHLNRENLYDMLRSTSRQLDRHVVFIGQGGQAADHPVHPAIPETDYLKAFFCVSGPSL